MNQIKLLLLFFMCTTLGYAQNVELQEVASGFDRPLALTHAFDDRRFVVEQDGEIHIIMSDGTSSLFLDIDNIVGSGGNEQGLLGLAFHPDYQNNGYFFVSYTANNGDSKISRFSVDPTNANIADASSEEVLLTIDQPYSNHNGGCIQFGADGYLYIGMGDGGSAGDPLNSGQDPQSLLGKMLRINVNQVPYSIPSDNPFVGDASTLDEIWAIGVRNPWRFSFDKETGDLWMGDVGQNDWEEINVQLGTSSGGENYGWKCYEGNHPYSTSNCDGTEVLTYPVHEYSNSFTQGCSVTGGYVYRGTDYPDLEGVYFFTDYCSGRLWTLTPDGDGGWTHNEALNIDNYNYGSFGEDYQGEIYLVGLDDGKIYKIAQTCVGFEAMATVEDVMCEGDSTGVITLTTPADVNIEWSTGDMNVSEITNLTAGDYAYTMTNAAGCEFEGNATINTEIMLTAPIITQMVNELNIPNEYASYQWYLEGVAIAGANSSSWVAQEDGNYSVEVTNSEGCSIISDVIPVMVLSANGVAKPYFNCSVFPNPFTNEIGIQMTGFKVGECKVKVKNILSQCVFEKEINVLSDDLHFINLENLQIGVYFLEVSQMNHKMVLKIAKQ